MNVAWAMFWGGSRSTKPCVFPCKVAAAGDERYLVCAAVAAAVVSVRQLFLLCVLQRSGCSCVRSSMRFLKFAVCRSHWNGCMDVAWALCCGEEAGARNLVFFRVKWLQPAMKGTLSVRRLRLRSFLCANCSSYVFCNEVVVPAYVSSMRFLKLCLQIALEWLHECCMGFVCGEEAGARNLVFFRVKWLQATMKGTSSVRRVRLGSFRSRIVPQMCFATKWLCPVYVVLCVS